MELVINLVSGLIGGNLLGALSKGKGLISSILGLVGGGVGNFFGPDILDKIGMVTENAQVGQAGVSAGVGGILALLAGLFTKKKKSD